MQNQFHQFVHSLDQLKHNKKTIRWIIFLDLVMSIGSLTVDWPWLMRVDWSVKIFAPICSLYPLLLLTWFTLYYLGKKIPTWFTSFIFVGIVSYGLMAWIFYPAYMTWKGFDLISFGNALWVTVYALQAFIIKSELKKMPWYKYAVIFAYFLMKDYSDRYLGSFWESIDTYPQTLQILLPASMLTIHIGVFAIILYLSKKPHSKLIPQEGSLL